MKINFVDPVIEYYDQMSEDECKLVVVDKYDYRKFTEVFADKTERDQFVTAAVITALNKRYENIKDYIGEK